MNVLTQWANEHERPLKYISQKTGFSYNRLHRYQTLTNEELKENLSLADIEQLETLIPGLTQILIGE